MSAIKSRAGRWSVSLCDCSEDTAHFHYGNVVLDISRGDLRELGHAMHLGIVPVSRRDNTSVCFIRRLATPEGPRSSSRFS